MSRRICCDVIASVACMWILPPRWRLNTRSDLPTKRAFGSASILRIEVRIRLLVDLDGDFPERAALLAAQRLQVFDGEPLVRNDGQHAGQGAGLVKGFDEENFWDFHGVPSGPSA